MSNIILSDIKIMNVSIHTNASSLFSITSSKITANNILILNIKSVGNNLQNPIYIFELYLNSIITITESILDTFEIPLFYILNSGMELFKVNIKNANILNTLNSMIND